MILDQIVADKIEEVKQKKKETPVEILKNRVKGKTKGFYRALSEGKGIHLIPELKKASPSKGMIREEFRPVELASICIGAGVSALSVLTEEKYFKGSLDYLKEISDEFAIPVLRKDFIFDEYQIIESRAYGADAVLLIADILDEKQLTKLLKISREYGMDCLVEMHRLDDLNKVLNAGARIIGINNRDLHTFEVDIKHTEKFISKMPEEKIIVSESGIATREDVEYMKAIGVNAVLVGESIMLSENIENKIKELLGRG